MATTCVLYDQRLKEEVGSLKRIVGTACVGKTCFLCRRDLGRIINRGACCPSCRQRVCKSCRQYGSSPNEWLCNLCYRQMEMKAVTGEWMNEIIEANKIKDSISSAETLKRTIQRSWTFSETSPSPWSYLRGSPEMRAYSSLPRDSDSLPAFVPRKTPPPSLQPSPETDKKLTSPQAVFRKVHLRIDSRNLPPGVTPPRSRRRLEKSDQDEVPELLKMKQLTPDSDDYKLVFLSSSDESSREELHSDEDSSTCSLRHGLLDWDYFECWSPDSGPVAADPAHDSLRPRPGRCASCPPHSFVPVPVPVPVPVFVPVPIAVRHGAMSLPEAELLPLSEVLSHKAVSPVLVRSSDEQQSVVLKVYKTLDTTDCPPSSVPEEILRLTEERLKDFTDIGDDDSRSSVSSDDEDAPSTRVYRLNEDDSSDGESSEELGLATTSTRSLSSSSDSSGEEDGTFNRILVIQGSDSGKSSPTAEQNESRDIESPSPNSEIKGKTDLIQISEEDDESPTESDRNNVLSTENVNKSENNEEKTELSRDNSQVTRHISPDPETLSEAPVDKIDKAPVVESHKCEAIDSIITFSHEEVLQIISEFIEAERKLNTTMEVENRTEVIQLKIEENTGYETRAEEDTSKTKVEETRSNTSDEFSGTESMEMSVDAVDCRRTEGGQEEAPAVTVEAEKPRETGKYTSLVMITSEPEQESVPAGPGPVCLEEGLADDDSWVEDLDRDDMPTTTDSSEDDALPDREEELRGYHRSAIDFTLHTIAEESCEDSEMEVEKNHPTELEKYFFYGLGECPSNAEERELDTMSETSSIYSEGVESNGDAENPNSNQDPAELASSRLEKYFLSGFMGFNRRDSDGSVGSDSEGRPSPEQRRKRLVRARGTGRQHSSSLDNLVDCEQQNELQAETEGSSTETDSHDEQSNSFDKGDGQFDTVKRTKKKKRSVPSAPSDLLEAPENSGSKEDLSEDGKKTPQPELSPSDLMYSRNKQQSRDSGFVGSCDDLLKDSHSPTETVKTEDLLTNKESAKCEQVPESPSIAPALSRKDSFNNWSSDEETNLMMSKMRAFFKTMVGNQPKGSSPNVKPKCKPPQLLYFESELTRLMKTVPGIRDEQVREIVEYLSSEDTWSDSYDSSDYTSSDLETGNKRTALQEEISASCRQIISNFETSAVEDTFLEPPQGGGNNDLVERWVASFNKMEVPKQESNQNSPPLIEKVMQHIGSRLWALMHEVSGGEGSPRRHKRLTSKLSATSTTEEEEEEEEEEDYTPLPRSKSHDPLLEEGRQEASDNERFSWRGSFESALMASDSRTRLASAGELAAKRRSAGDLMFKNSREQLDRVRSCGSIGGSVEEKIWRQETRRLSVGESEEEDAGSRATLPRSLQASCPSATNSLPRLPTSQQGSGGGPSIYKAHSLHQFGVKSARYRPPGYRGSPVAPPPRRDRRRNASSVSSLPQSNSACDDSSVCSEPIGKTDEEVDRLITHHRASLGARSDSLASVYSGAGEGRHGGVAVRGEVQFGLQYNYKQSSLEIHVKQCRDLAPVDTKRNRSDPYVKVYLLPDKSKSGKRKTRVKKHTLNPIFDEVLRFQVNLDGLENRTLWLSVWHSDMFGRNDFLGEVLMPLENKVFDDPLPKFYTLQERSETLEELSSKGELIIGLKYEPPDENCPKKKSRGSLHVLIKEAKNLPALKSNMSSDPFCKSYLLPDKGRWSKQKAPVIRKTCNPIWNHTFSYQNVSLQELSERSLELTIWDHDRLSSNEFLGGVRLNLGTGKHHGKAVDWMDSSGNEIMLWERMLERPNFWVESCLPLRTSLDLRSNL
ncbi:uncharacterized protein [Halyomorpha halys]|uniref:uncharacterized protein isoform X2 n=1 Tax=Halyomorpha halys TaxID=286706 RepID=UPI0006D52341